MQRKMEGLEWSEKAQQYCTTIEQCVVYFRTAVINNYGHKEEQVTTTLQQNGFTLTVCEDFMD